MKLLPDIFFLSYQKKISPKDVLIILQRSRSVLLHHKWFLGENKERKTAILKKHKQIRCFNIINIIECWCKIGCTSKSHSPKMNYLIFCCYIIPDGCVWFTDKLLCFCDVWKGQSYVNVYVCFSSIFDNGQFYLKY